MCPTELNPENSRQRPATVHGAIILAGGHSRRMGRPKAWLPFGDQTLLQRILETVGKVTTCRIVVAAKNQPLPKLPANTLVTHDEHPDYGPLEGIRCGLKCGAEHADAFYISSCDVPMLKPEFVRFLQRRMEIDNAVEIVVPRDEQYFHPLAAVYHRQVLPHVEALLERNERRPRMLFASAKTEIVPTSNLTTVDPELLSLRNLNTPEQYEAALKHVLGG